MTTTIREPINFFWHGSKKNPDLSLLEVLSLKSHLYHGHPCRLWTYGNVGNIPSGVDTFDASQVLSRNDAEAFRHRQVASNYFRYKLLYSEGGWYSDLDSVCLKPFDFQQELVYASVHPQQRDIAGVGVFRVPVNCPALRTCLKFMDDCDSDKIPLMVSSNWLFTLAMKCHGLWKGVVLKWNVFHPIVAAKWGEILDPADRCKHTLSSLEERAYALHLWHHQWSLRKMNKNKTFVKDSLFEQLKEKYL